MATMIVKHRVADFDAWKKVFDGMNGTRKEHNWTSHEVYRDAHDPSLVVIVNHMKTLDDAKRYGTSDALTSAMKNAGVLGPPEITFLDDADERSY